MAVVICNLHHALGQQRLPGIWALGPSLNRLGNKEELLGEVAGFDYSPDLKAEHRLTQSKKAVAWSHILVSVGPETCFSNIMSACHGVIHQVQHIRKLLLLVLIRDFIFSYGLTFCMHKSKIADSLWLVDDP